MDVNEIQMADASSGSQNGVSPMEIAEVLEQKIEVKKSLLQSVLDTDLKHEDLARNWLEKYVQNSNAALVDILQLVVEASGTQYLIPKATVRPFVYRDILRASAEKFRTVSHHYPMIVKSSAQFFEHNVGSFVQCLLKLAGGTPIIYDQVFLCEVTGFVMACSESNVRPIRHTSTMIGLKMMTTLNELETPEADGSLKRLWLRMFECLFVDRHQDVVTGIRLLCITELVHWMRKYPAGHLQANSMRYFYQGLKDSFGYVRKCCLESIIEFSDSKEELLPLCLELAEEFRDLLMLICVDSESELGRNALCLLTSFYRYYPELLSNVDCRLLDQLMFAAHRGLSHAAAEFFKLRWLDPLQGESPSHTIQRLIDFFVGYGQHEHAAYLVDAMIDSCDLILDWQTMVNMLLEDQVPPRRNPAESSALIEILCRGVKQAITGEIPPGRYTKNLQRQPKLAAQLRATQVLAPVLSQLLVKYVSKPYDLENLLELPQHLNLHYYRPLRHSRQLEMLMQQIKEIMMAHSHNSVLRMGSLTLECFYDMSLAKPHLQELLDRAVTKYKQALRTWQHTFGTPQAAPPPPPPQTTPPGQSASRPISHARNLMHSLRLVSALYRHFDLSGYNLTESVLSSLMRLFRDQTVGSDDLPTEVMVQYLEVCYYSISWDLRSVRSEDYSGNDLELEESCAALKKHLEDFLGVATNLVARGNWSVGFDSFAIMCDLFVMFGDPVLQSPSLSVRSIHYEPSIREFDMLEHFVLEHILTGCPNDLVKVTSFERLQRRREILTAYCKLLAFNVIPSMRSCRILQFYDKYNEAFGDIMRAAMDRALDINPVNYGMTMLHTCLVPFRKIMSDVNNDGVRAMSTLEFLQLINLARRLSETFNSDLLKNRHSVNALHRAGILFVLESVSDVPIAAPKHLLFLTVIKEFVPQLLQQDRAKVLKFLKRIEQPTLPSVRIEEWKPLVEYRAALFARGRISC